MDATRLFFLALFSYPFVLDSPLAFFLMMFMVLLVVVHGISFKKGTLNISAGAYHDLATI
jgi:hypothetical protein